MGYHITSAPMIHWKDYALPDGGFKSTATSDRPVITSMKQKRDYMERNELLDANEHYTPPTLSEERKTIAQIQGTIDAITPNDKQMRQMKDDGILDIVK